jgi:hypothetical protein
MLFSPVYYFFQFREAANFWMWFHYANEVVQIYMMVLKLNVKLFAPYCQGSKTWLGE